MKNSYIHQFDGEFEFLSNKFLSTFVYKNVKYKSVTHAYQSLKAKNESDQLKIRNAKTPNDAISLGRKVEVKSDWQLTNREIMEELIYEKFHSNIFLRPKLLATGDAKLGNDRNFVGNILMTVRDRIRKNNYDE